MAGGKKGGKTAAKAKAEENKQVEAQAVETTEAAAAEGGKKKSNNLFIDRVSNKFIHERDNAKDGKKYFAVSYNMGDGQYGSFLVKPGQVIPTTKKVKDAEGNTKDVPVEGYSNILLGTKGQHYEVSINDKDKNFPKASLTAEQIKTAYDSSKQAYKDAKAAEKAASKDAKAADKTAEAGDVELGD